MRMREILALARQQASGSVVQSSARQVLDEMAMQSSQWQNVVWSTTIASKAWGSPLDSLLGAADTSYNQALHLETPLLGNIQSSAVSGELQLHNVGHWSNLSAWSNIVQEPPWAASLLGPPSSWSAHQDHWQERKDCWCVKETLISSVLMFVATYPATTYSTPQLQAVPPDNDITNTTIFVGGLDPNVTEEELRQIYAQYGELVYVKIPAGKGCGFIQFTTRASAEESIQRTHGTMIGQQIVRLSWGRNPEAKPDQSAMWGQQADPNQWASYYGYGYDPYAYGAAQDPSLYAYGAYAGYGQYPQQVEGAPEMASMTAAVPAAEHREEPYDPLAVPDIDIDKLNAAYLAVHGNTMLGRPLWLKTSSLLAPA